MKKGERTKQRITEAARGLFAERGFTAITMKDVCISAEISRGGLYAYFSSPADILEEIIRLEQEKAYAALNEAIKGNISPYSIIRGFLSVRAEEISNTSRSISGAINQFARSGERGQAIVKKRALDAVKILTGMIRLGQEQGIFRGGDPEEYACGILWLTEGMNAHAELLGISPEKARKQLFLSVDMLKTD